MTGAPLLRAPRLRMPALQRRTDHQLDEEPSSALLAVASPSASPSIAARQPRSAQSCCATAPAATRRVEVVVLAVISILLFALSFRMLTGLFRRRTYCAAANGTRLSAFNWHDQTALRIKPPNPGHEPRLQAATDERHTRAPSVGCQPTVRDSIPTDEKANRRGATLPLIRPSKALIHTPRWYQK